MASYDEVMKGQGDHLDAKPDFATKEKSVASETQGMNMQISAPASESFLNRAVNHLNKMAQRGEHSPTVGGYKHDSTMR